MKVVSGRVGIVLAALAGLVLLGAGVASAHVTVSAPQATAGGYGEITFRVPTESDTASTVGLRVQLPKNAPLASVSIKPVPGWTATTSTTHLARPVTNDDGDTISDVVSQITWTAAPGQGIAPGQYQTFSISAGPLPKVSTLAFPTIQTYSDGTTVAWIDPTVPGQPEPQHPAPTLHLAGADTQPQAAASGSSHAAASAADSGPSGWTITALVLGGVALIAAVAGLVVALSPRRRTPVS